MDKEKKKMEEPKERDSEQKGGNNRTYNFRSVSTRAKIETKERGKDDNINPEIAQ